MLELSLAYLAAAVLIGGLLYLAVRNHKRGWRKQRNVWGEAQSAAALASIERQVDPPVEHFSDLARLQNALAIEDKTARKEQLTPTR
jgi:hypothetical protein